MKLKYLNIFIICILSLSIIGSVNAVNWDKNPDTTLLYEIAQDYQNLGIECIIVKLDANKLKHGDYIQLRNFKDEALFYSSKDTNGVIYFGDTYGSFFCTEEVFNKIYTGYALLTN